jgi:hypothetical protein
MLGVYGNFSMHLFTVYNVYGGLSVNVPYRTINHKYSSKQMSSLNIWLRFPSISRTKISSVIFLPESHAANSLLSEKTSVLNLRKDLQGPC